LTKKTINIAPPNSIVFVFDRGNKTVEIPEYVNNRVTVASKSCVSVCTLAEMDGETEVTLSNSQDDQIKSDFAFSDEFKIETPSLELSVSSSQNVELLTTRVEKETTNIRVYYNDKREPDRIAIEVLNV
jgi:hypothetical protein